MEPKENKHARMKIEPRKGGSVTVPADKAAQDTRPAPEKAATTKDKPAGK